MYQLTLTRGERGAIDWVGDRYAHGRGLYVLLMSCHDGDVDWDDDSDITFRLPEHVAWQIADLIDADGLACFADVLSAKLYHLAASIV